MFSKYAATVKNLRGMVFARLDEPGVEESLAWLMRRFKYRDLAVPPSLAELRKRGGFSRLLEAFYPVEGLKGLVKLFSEEFSLPGEAVEAVVLASAYVSPILAVGEKAAEDLKPLAVETVESKSSLDDKGWKLHFRIVDYTVLDAYGWSVTHAEKLWRPGFNPQTFEQERLTKIRGDIKRYWRLAQGGNPPKPLILYLDLALLASRSQSLLEKLRRLRLEEASAGLALEAAILIPGGLGKN